MLQKVGGIGRVQIAQRGRQAGCVPLMDRIQNIVEAAFAQSFVFPIVQVRLDMRHDPSYTCYWQLIGSRVEETGAFILSRVRDNAKVLQLHKTRVKWKY
ncbi:hypothetical protein [Falsirhodobacter sp. alg1]|uniref:hypothetical protein n=1 Tax=Falsirhodobacter sp. alg1 TaxID=1472418 RepID=UPI0005EFDC44|nr:hypothetical protein [Falsirhodobacter sp. alg1]